MKKLRRRIGFLLPLMLLFLLAGQAFAGLKNVGPTDPVSTLPKYYLDTNNLALEPCLDQNGMCLLGPPFDPAGVPPISTITTTAPVNDANFPGESFYYSAAALLPIEGGELANLAFVLEAAFLSGVVPDGGITFLRTDLQKMRNLTPNSTYLVTHPYGTFTFTTDAIGDTTGGGGVAIRLEDGPAVPVQWLPPGMKAATNTGIGPFLTPASGTFPTALVNGETHTYIGDGNPVAVTGSPTGNNFFRVERLDAAGVPVPGALWETPLFALNGRIFTGPIPSELSYTATYARNETSGQVDIFATAQPGAVLTLSGTGILPTPLVPAIPEIGKYFLHIPLGSSTLPTDLVITNSLDLQSTPPHPVNLVDEIIVFKALYNPSSRELMIEAQSRDKVAPPVLSVTGFAGSTLNAAGKVVLTLPAGAVPSSTVQVVSSYGGFATAPVIVVIPPPPPVANDDTAATAMNSAVSVNVLANDVSQGGIDASSVTVVDQPASGATAIAGINGSITYTPTSTFTGTETFTYTVKDVYGQTSNTATVTVTVHEPPVAGNDIASAVVGTTIAMDVIANDSATASSINSTTVNIVSPVSCGSTSVQANGTVSFTAPADVPAGDGTCSFSYTVSDTFTPPAVSNVAVATITITPLPDPVASISVISTLTSPQAPNTPITFVAAGTGGSGNYEYRFWLNSGAGYAETQPYSTASSWTWTPADTGTYDVLVDVRNAGSTVVRDVSTNVFQYKIATPATAVTLVENLASPQPSGTPITFTAAASGGSGPYEYRFWVNEGNGYAIVQNYSTTDTFIWSPTKVGNYDILVDTRIVNSASFRDALATKLAYQIAPVPATAVTLTPSVASPQVPGSSVTFTAEASGGTGPYEYRFWINSGGTFLIAQDYTTINSFTWTPLAAGNYDIMVDTRAVGSTNFREALAVNSFYQIMAAPASGVIASIDKTSPQPINAPIVITAAGSGGSGAYEYRFWLNSGSGYSIVQDYSTLPTWTWFPVATGNFDMLIDVRNAGTTSVRDASTNIFFYQIQ